MTPAHHSEETKTRARNMVREAVREALLPADGPCCACQNHDGVLWHHPDYSRPLFVVWLCRSCHSRVHCGLLLDPGTGVPYPKFPPRWQTIPSELRRHVRNAAERGLPPKRIPVEIFDAELDRMGLREQFERVRSAREAAQERRKAEGVAMRARAEEADRALRLARAAKAVRAAGRRAARWTAS